MTKLTVLSSSDKLAEIRRLYFAATRQTIERDFAAAVQLLTSMETEEERERARVFMDGLAQMRSDWERENRRKGAKPVSGTRGPGKPAAGARGPGKAGGGAVQSRGEAAAAKPAKDQPRPPRRGKPSDD